MARQFRLMSACAILVASFISASAASAESVSSAASEPNPMLGLVAAALVGVLSALATQFTGDRFSRSNERRLKKATHDEIVRNYLSPLADACGRLLWRMREAFPADRAQWGPSDAPEDFVAYKRQSMLYRIATLLAWMRAIEIELSALPQASAILATPLSKAMSDVRNALASGTGTEQLRLDGLARCWKLNLTELDEKKRERLATRLRVEMYRSHAPSRKNPLALKTAPQEELLEVCVALNRMLSLDLAVLPLSRSKIAHTLEQARGVLSYYETLIYNNWQDAIADSMLRPEKDSVRRFNVIGLKDFVKLLNSEDVWIAVFRSIVLNLDFDQQDPSDRRTEQLKELSKKTADVVIAIAGRESHLVSPGTLSLAEEFKRFQLPVLV